MKALGLSLGGWVFLIGGIVFLSNKCVASYPSGQTPWVCQYSYSLENGIIGLFLLLQSIALFLGWKLRKENGVTAGLVIGGASILLFAIGWIMDKM